MKPFENVSTGWEVLIRGEWVVSVRGMVLEAVARKDSDRVKEPVPVKLQIYHPACTYFVVHTS